MHLIATTLFAVLAGSTFATASPISARSNGVSYINFYKQWQQVASNDIQATDKIVVNYDLDRVLPLCNATVNTPNTTVTAFYQIHGQVNSLVLLDTHPSPVYQNQTFTIPALQGPGDLQFWFSCASNSSAPKYDSNLGNNYHFNVNGAQLYFAPDFTTITTGTVQAGEPVLVQYNITRVQKICPTDATHFDLTITGNYQVNNGAVTQFPIYSQQYAFHSGPIHSYSEGVIPASAVSSGSISFWFTCQSGIASGYDSNFGKNWVFGVSA
ncbi:hypothetical protein HDU76_001679 [Blyttiomyces sp. JEL0837]|nr:hypothetical protein HDU76_001679 [Blyttiomyces sp. JEL0837]